MKKLEKKYYIAIRKKENPEDFFWEHKDYSFAIFRNKNKRYWLADPFLFEYNSKTYLFYEAFDRIKEVGTIAYSIVSDDIISEPKIIIRGKRHFSFPNVFEHKNKIFMLPETCDKKKICIFEAIDFPNVWKEVSIVDNIYSCDTIVVNDNNIDYLLSSEMSENIKFDYVPSCYVFNKLIKVNSDLRPVEEGTTVAIGDYGIRNAGAIFNYNGLRIRPGQDCRYGKYGRGIVFFSIHSLQPYKEERMRELTKEEIKNHVIGIKNIPLVGTHTYNISSKYEVVDLSVEEKTSVIIRSINSLVKWSRRVKGILLNAKK